MVLGRQSLDLAIASDPYFKIPFATCYSFHWPIIECLHFFYIENVTFTSSGVGTLDGQGELWWGLPGIGYLVREENRY